MKVLMLAPGNSPHSRRLIELLLTEGCAVACVDGQNPLPNASANYDFIPLPPVRGIRFRWFRNHLEARVRGWQLRRLWNRLRPDVVNVQWIDVRAEACARARLRPLVLSCWGTDINRLFTTGHEDPAERRRVASTIARADCITADSPEVLQRCELLAGRPVPSKLLFFGIDPELFKPGYAQEARDLRQRLGIPSGSKVILSPRRGHPSLGQRHILEAFASIAEQRPGADAVLVFRHYLTSSDAFEQELRQQVEKLGLGRKVFWLGETSYQEVPAHYAMSDLVVNYPEQDGFPVSLFEAAMCRRPVITSRLPGIRGGIRRRVCECAASRPAGLGGRLAAMPDGTGRTDPPTRGAGL